MIFYVNGEKFEGSWILVDENGISIDGCDRQYAHIFINQNSTIAITVINCSEETGG